MPQEYPYAQQEAQLLAQIAARRKAYMQKYGNAEQQFTQQQTGGNTDEDQELLDDNNLFAGDILG